MNNKIILRLMDCGKYLLLFLLCCCYCYSLLFIGRCKYHGKVPFRCGLEKVIVETESILIEQCAQSFIMAQKVRFELKDKYDL